MNNERSSAGNLNRMETDIRALIGDTDPETLSAPEVLGVMVEHFHPRLSLACSFQREESVLLDMLLGIAPDARVFALDTHVLFPETYDVWRQVEKRYGIQVEVYQGPSLGRQAAIHGEALWERNPTLCCSIRKVAHALSTKITMAAFTMACTTDTVIQIARTPTIGMS